jgi:hypothetical protein
MVTKKLNCCLLIWKDASDSTFNVTDGAQREAPVLDSEKLLLGLMVRMVDAQD